MVNQSFENCFLEVIVDCTLVVIFLYTDTLYGSENLYRKKSMETEAPAEWGEYKKGTDYKASPAWVMETATMAAEGSGL